MNPPFTAFIISAKKAGTDPAMVENFANRMSPTGRLEGRTEQNRTEQNVTFVC